MCTIAVLYRTHPEFPLIVAANRDEFYARPTSGPQVLIPSPRVVGGRDLASGGTWLALRADGSLLAVTNQRTYSRPDPERRSRGLAVLEALAAPDAAAAVAALDPRAYNGGNFVAGNADRLVVAYLRADTSTLEIEELTPGLHILANDRLGSPDFPRTERLRELVEPHMTEPWSQLAPRLHVALGDHQRPSPASLATPPVVVDGQDLRTALEQTCIHTPIYGTRWATVAALTRSGVAQYLYADGAPCVTPLRDGTDLLSGP